MPTCMTPCRRAFIINEADAGKLVMPSCSLSFDLEKIGILFMNWLVVLERSQEDLSLSKPKKIQKLRSDYIQRHIGRKSPSCVYNHVQSIVSLEIFAHFLPVSITSTSSLPAPRHWSVELTRSKWYLNSF